MALVLRDPTTTQTVPRLSDVRLFTAGSDSTDLVERCLHTGHVLVRHPIASADRRTPLQSHLHHYGPCQYRPHTPSSVSPPPRQLSPSSPSSRAPLSLLLLHTCLKANHSHPAPAPSPSLGLPQIWSRRTMDGNGEIHISSREIPTARFVNGISLLSPMAADLESVDLCSRVELLWKRFKSKIGEAEKVGIKKAPSSGV